MKVRIYKDKTWHVELDGVDISRFVCDGGVQIEWREYPLPPVVTLRIMAEAEVELPEAEVVR